MYVYTNIYLSKNEMLEAVNEEEAIAYVGLKIMFDKMLTKEKDTVEANFNIANLFYEISGSFNSTATDKKKIVTGIQGLIDAGVVQLIDSDDKGNYVLDIAGLKIESQYDAYTVMTRDEIRNIFNIPCKQKFNLLRFGIGIFGTINSQNGCGFASFRKMPDFTGVKRVASCQEYFKKLEEYNIIYVRHSDKAKRDKTGKIKNLSNCYGRPCDKEKIDKFYIDRCIKQGHDFTNTMGTARKAQVTRNYNKYLNNAYNGDTIELIRECLAYNKIPYNEQHPENQKDMSVFDSDLIRQAEEGLQEHIKQNKKLEKEEAKTSEKEPEVNGPSWMAILSPAIVKIHSNIQNNKHDQENDNDYEDNYDYYGFDNDPFDDDPF